ncbi:hypothetical protein RDI58_024357 [Solanum bulbocastanum]|uniref:Uncharacterized protein n=1 Tax=Solanum bulbocastanum TaxID=147425 RepID=A0AAN8Y388_SOLBU
MKQICVGCVKLSLKLCREGEIDAEGGQERSNATHSGEDQKFLGKAVNPPFQLADSNAK